jgi:hypothetical protein
MGGPSELRVIFVEKCAELKKTGVFSAIGSKTLVL